MGGSGCHRERCVVESSSNYLDCARGVTNHAVARSRSENRYRSFIGSKPRKKRKEKLNINVKDVIIYEKILNSPPSIDVPGPFFSLLHSAPHIPHLVSSLFSLPRLPSRPLSPRPLPPSSTPSVNHRLHKADQFQLFVFSRYFPLRLLLLFIICLYSTAVIPSLYLRSTCSSFDPEWVSCHPQVSSLSSTISTLFQLNNNTVPPPVTLIESHLR
jgi:hypothetical protein